MVQLSHPNMITGKTVALTLWTFVTKVKSLLFNILSRFAMGFPGGSDGKESACNEETQVQFQSRENPLEKGMATHSSILA